MFHTVFHTIAKSELALSDVWRQNIPMKSYARILKICCSCIFAKKSSFPEKKEKKKKLSAFAAKEICRYQLFLKVHCSLQLMSKQLCILNLSSA